MAAKRMLWLDETIQAAVDSILHDNRGLRETARLYNIPVETLRRYINSNVEVGARPGPATILTDEEEDMLVKYLVEMADIWYGWTRKTIMELSFKRVSEKIPFLVERLVGQYMWDFDGATHSYLYELHSHFLTAEPFPATKQQLMIFWQTRVSLQLPKSHYKAYAYIQL